MMELRTTHINFYDCKDNPILFDPTEMDKFLVNLVNFISMTVIPSELMGGGIKNPNSFLFEPSNRDKVEYGVTGIVILYESHIAAHSFPYKHNGFINIIITSCKDYDPKLTLLWLCACLGSTNYKYFSQKL